MFLQTMMNMMMSKKSEGPDLFGEHTFIVNSNNIIVKSLAKLSENSENEPKIKIITNNIYDLALLSQNNLKGDRLIEFIKRSNDILKVYK